MERKYNGEKYILIDIKTINTNSIYQRKCVFNKLNKIALLIKEDRETNDFTQNFYFLNNEVDFLIERLNVNQKRELIKKLTDSIYNDYVDLNELNK